MPYISDAERERARWMTPAELITLIAEHDGCNRSAAWKQICDALSDRKLHIKWEKEPLRLSPYIVYVHRPPEGANFWQQADIDDDGKVFDPETDNRRTLLILKDDIFKNDIFQLGPQPSAKLGGPQSAYDEVKQTYYRLLPRVKTMAPAEVAKLIAKECGKKIGDAEKKGDDGWAMRTLLQHIQRIRAEH